VTAKSISIKGAERKSGGCARKASELTPGGLHRVPDSRLRVPRGSLTAMQKSAEGIVPSKKLVLGKARTAGEASRTYPWRTTGGGKSKATWPSKRCYRVKPEGTPSEGPNRLLLDAYSKARRA